MAKQKFYIIIKAEGEKFTVALPTNDMLAIYCYIDKLVTKGTRWQSYFVNEAYVREKFKPTIEEFDYWAREE